jgi:predicted Zn-dependent protease with MMP-like domain
MPRRSRDRHGRGLRGGLAPSGVPLALSRSARFDDLVLESVERLERHWGPQLAGVVFAVEDVPPIDGSSSVPDSDGEPDPVPLGRTIPGHGNRPPRVVIHRRPIESRAAGRARAVLVHEVVVEQVAELLGIDPEAVDPEYGEFE